MRHKWWNRDPWLMLFRAYLHLGKEYASTASFEARGYYMPWQQEALSILESCRNQVR